MRVLPVEVDGETIEALDVERELLGFESRSAYVRWLLEHRGSIEHEGDREPLIAVYRERIAQLEERLRLVEDETTGDTGRDAHARPPSPDDGRDSEQRDDGQSRPESGSASGSGTGTGTTATEDDASATEPSHETPPREERADAEGGTESDDDATIEGRGDPRTTVVKEPVTPTASGDDESESDDDPVARDRETDREITSMHLAPEQVARVRGDAVSEDASVLGSVETERLDELTRRAVSETRRRLDRDVETGLEYSSSTGLAESDVRPGEDVTEVGELSVPGRSDGLVERRQAVAGRAIAFLRDEGRARKSDFVDELYDEFPVEYETSDGWWRCIKGALEQVDAIDGGDGARVWQFTR